MIGFIEVNGLAGRHILNTSDIHAVLEPNEQNKIPNTGIIMKGPNNTHYEIFVNDSFEDLIVLLSAKITGKKS